jgi:hypothetical protein
VNVDGCGAHEHRGGVGVRLRYLIWPEVGQKGVVDGEAARVFTGSDGWGVGGGEGVAGSLLRDDVVLLVPLVGAEGRCSVRSTARPSGGGA